MLQSGNGQLLVAGHLLSYLLLQVCRYGEMVMMGHEDFVFDNVLKAELKEAMNTCVCVCVCVEGVNKIITTCSVNNLKG